MAQVHLPRSLVALFPDAPRRLVVPAADLASLIRDLDARYPGMWDRLCEPGPRLRAHINVFVDGRRVGLAADLDEASVVHVIPAVSGGAGGGDDAGAEPERVHPESVEEWRAWLAANHARPGGVWLVAWKARTGRPRMAYEEAVEEALAWGWIDSRAGRLDDDRETIWMSPRRRGSVWSRSNKERVARLEAEGRMTDAGRAAVERAKADGSWTLLDSVEDLRVPDDLDAALAALPGAREQWDGFPPSARRALLAWIVMARREETRRRRVQATSEAAQRGERANERPVGRITP
jgi:uncharacterized protein YdeI (YjbR/CyaY-like superfamily)/molybdopterin converting factor small subunit